MLTNDLEVLYVVVLFLLRTLYFVKKGVGNREKKIS